MIKVLLVDDHELVRTGIRRLLNDVIGINVYAEADSGEAAIEMVRESMPDVVLMDISMPGMGGLEATRRLSTAFPELNIIVLTAHVDEPFPTQMLKAGARGYLTKGSSTEEMVRAIHQVVGGKPFLSPDVAQSLALSMLHGNENPLQRLSQRELQIMMLLIHGKRPTEISQKLDLSPKTVSTYRARLYEKLGVANDAELVRLAMHEGLFENTS